MCSGRRRDRIAVLLLLVSLWHAQSAGAGENCTWGIDCPLDCWFDTPGTGTNQDCGGLNAGLICAGPACSEKRGGNGIPIRTSAVGGVGKVLGAEDFEDPDYRNHTATGDGWYSSGNWPGERMRGGGNAWYERFGFPSADCAIKENWPQASQCSAAGAPWPCCVGPGSGACPQYGVTCGTSTQNNCTADEWTLGAEKQPDHNPQTEANIGPCLDIFDGLPGDSEEFNDEAGALGIPDCPGADGLPGTADDVPNCGPFDGEAAMRERWPAGCGTGGAIGGLSWPRATTIGVTFAMAWPDDHSTSNIDDAPLKFEEFEDRQTVDPACPAGMSEFWINGGPIHGGPFPLGGFLFVTDQAAVIASQTGSPRIGSLSLNREGGCVESVKMQAGSNYIQATDFPFGSWACIQARFSNIGTAAARLEKWINGEKVFDVTFNGTYMRNKNGYSRFFWDSYANAGACQSDGAPGINQISSRARDNFVLTDGNPVGCAEIGSEVGSTTSCGPDSDHDGIGDSCDHCPDYASSSNADLDHNGIGDVCECGDQNGDAVVNVLDLLDINMAIFGAVPVSPLCDTNNDVLCNVQDIVGANQKIFGRPAYCSRYPAPAP